MVNNLKNFLNYDITKQIINFFEKYKYIILASYLIAVIINAIDIFTIKWPIDSEAYSLNKEPFLYLYTRRYGSVILFYLFPILKYHIISQLMGLFFLILASLLIVSKYSINNFIKFLFVILVITYPNFSHLQYFYFQSAYNFLSFLLVVVSYRLVADAPFKLHIRYFIALLLLYIAIGSYQSVIAVYLSIMMINIIFQFLEDSKFKSYIYIYILKHLVVLLIGVGIYYLSVKLIAGGFNSNHAGMFVYNSSNFIDKLSSVIKISSLSLISKGSYGNYNLNIIFSILYCISIIFYFFKAKKKSDFILLLFLLISFVIAIFSLNIAMGWMIGKRTALSSALYAAFSIILFTKLINYNFAKNVVFFMVIIAVIYNGNTIIKNQMQIYMVSENDQLIATEMLQTIYKEAPDIYDKKYKIVFYGQIHNPSPNILYGKRDEFIGVTQYIDEKDSHRYLSLLKIKGLPTYVNLIKQTPETNNIASKMPSWPASGYVKVDDDIIIVKLREEK